MMPGRWDSMDQTTSKPQRCTGMARTGSVWQLPTWAKAQKHHRAKLKFHNPQPQKSSLPAFVPLPVRLEITQQSIRKPDQKLSKKKPAIAIRQVQVVKPLVHASRP